VFLEDLVFCSLNNTIKIIKKLNFYAKSILTMNVIRIIRSRIIVMREVRRNERSGTG